MNISTESVTKSDESEIKVINELIEQIIESSKRRRLLQQEYDCNDCGLEVDPFGRNCSHTDAGVNVKAIVLRIKSLWTNDSKYFIEKLEKFEKTNKLLKRENCSLRTKLRKTKILSESRIKCLKIENQFLKTNKMNNFEKIVVKNFNNNNAIDFDMNESNDSIEIIHESINENNIDNNVQQNANSIVNNNSNFWRPFEIQPNVSTNIAENQSNFGQTFQIYRPLPIYAYDLNRKQNLISSSTTTTIRKHLCGNTVLKTYTAEPQTCIGIQPKFKARKLTKQVKQIVDKSPKGEEKDRKECLKCEFSGCSKIFKFQSALTNHQLVHSNEKRFSCRQCDKKYKQLSGLYSHQNSKHSANKQFVCGYCGQQFVDIRNLKIHEYNRHKSGDKNRSDSSDAIKKKVYLQLRSESTQNSSQF